MVEEDIGMNKKEKLKVLQKAQDWFEKTISDNHIRNTIKLSNPLEFNINPFLLIYLTNFLSNNSEPKNIARALVYPRVLGTSINTSFGMNIQSFTNDVLSSYGSTTTGIDIEFIDQKDDLKKYCQLKAGPQTINSDDVKTISDHFKSIINLGRANNLKLGFDNLIVGVIYGEECELSHNYKSISNNHNFPVFIGQEFWERLTGDSDFYFDIIKSIGEVAVDANFSKELDEVINQLADSPEIKKLSKGAS